MPVSPHLPRTELIAALAARFPEAARLVGSETQTAGGQFAGGRAEAVARLEAFDPAAYARSRNDVGGAVSRLSPWIRHGVLSLAEVRDAAIERAGAEAEKFVSELGWRAYWREVQAAVGNRIFESIESPAAVSRVAPVAHMPADVLAAATGMACIDDFVRRLHANGWLHNHERMWLASWLVHVRGVAWRAGADWFLSHLLDGDPASNHLSWQWVAGRFSAKPYLFNRENLERFTAGVHCRPCSLHGHCDMEGDYDTLAARLFSGSAGERSDGPLRLRPRDPWQSTGIVRRPLVWITLDSLSERSPAAVAWPDAPRLFVVDQAWLDDERPALGRLVFIWECLADLPAVEILVGDPAGILSERMATLGCDGIAVADTPCPRVRRAVEAISATKPVAVERWPRFCDTSKVQDLGRFSRFWQKVKASAMRPTAG